MAYNPNLYPYYQNAYNTYPIPQNVSQPVQNSELRWVQGESAAKAVLLTPGSTVALWDTEDQIIYLKSADASGMPSMKILDYTIRENTDKTPKMPHKTDFATKADISIIQDQINEIKANISRRKGNKNEPTLSADE